MATQTVNLAYDTSTVANYKAIMSQFGAALSAFGWIQTADTGQVTWSGVTTLPGNGTFRDWEIWRMNDTAQSSMPVFMKLEYSTQGTNAPALKITVGAGSNGSGTITGLIILPATTFTANQSTSLGASTVFPCYYSGTTGRFQFFIFGNTNGEMDLSIERSKDTTGADTTEFVNVTGLNYSGGSNFQNTGTLTGFTTSCSHALAFIGPASNNLGGATAACPQFALIGKVSNPLMGMCFTPVADLGQGGTFGVNIYGASHTYLATKTIINSVGPSGALGYGGNTVAVLIRFE